MHKVDWSYFKSEKGRFVAKRLPTPKKATVKFKDDTDLVDIRDFLRDAQSFQEGIEEYKHYFDDPIAYEVEVESFIEAVTKNRNQFLGPFSFLKNQPNLLYEAMEESESEDGNSWLIVEPKDGKRMVSSGLFSKVEPTREIWEMFLNSRYRVVDLKELAAEKVKLSGRKAEQIRQFIEGIDSGVLSHEPPFCVRKEPGFISAISTLQAKYVEEIEKSLSQWTYPDTFAGAVWEMVLDENDEWEDVCATVKERYERLLPDDIMTETKTEFMGSGPVVKISVSYDESPGKVLPPEVIQRDLKASNPTAERFDTFDAPPHSEISPKVIQFDYEDAQGNLSQRRVKVTNLWRDGVVYFQGLCYSRKAGRTFRTDRIRNMATNHASGKTMPAGQLRSIDGFRTFLEGDTSASKVNILPWFILGLLVLSLPFLSC